MRASVKEEKLEKNLNGWLSYLVGLFGIEGWGVKFQADIGLINFITFSINYY